DDAVTTGIDLADHALVGAGGFDHSRRGGVDHGGNPAGLCVKGVSGPHCKLPELAAPARRPTVEIARILAEKAPACPPGCSPGWCPAAGSGTIALREEI